MVLKSAKKAVLLLMVMAMIIACFAVMPATQIPPVAQAAGEYTGDDPVKMDLGVFNFNPDWKHYKPETPQGPYITACSGVKQGDLNFWDVAYNDSAWVDVTLPHTINDEDAFHSRADPNGDLGTYVGVVFYRKHFRLPSAYEGKKVFIEFEGVRQAAYVYLNGEIVGFYQAGVSAFGFDLSAHNLNFGDDENVIAVGIDCSGTWGGSSANVPLPENRPAGAWYNLTETRPGSAPGTNDGQRYVWNYHNFNTMQGGINKNVYLHVKDKIFQTLPLYANLQTQGTYVYPTDIDVANRSATINVEAEVRNEDVAKAVTMEVVLVDKNGDVVGSFESASVNVPLATDISQNKTAHYTNVIVPNAYNVVSNVAPLPPIAQPGLTNPDDWGWRSVTKITASGIVGNLNLWSLDDPYLYDVYTILKDSVGNRLDVRKITTGFRKIVFKGNTPGNMGGIEINDEFVWLTGYAQRSTCEWASLGIAPDWLNDYDMGLVKESNANHVRWMHIAPPPSLVRASDRYGILVTVPCGDAEQDETGRSWVQRVELMRNVIIYFRNNPSVFTWEIGNNSVSNQHLTDMKITKDRLDPIAKGNRAIGCRQISASAASSTGMEYASFMEATASTTNGRDISPNMPFLEAEYMRDEAPRRVWDRYSPPDYDFKHIYSGSEQSSSTTSNPMRDGWDHTSEDLVVRGVSKYNIYWPNRVRGGSATPHFSGIAVLCWSDSDQHGRMPESQNARMSGRVDAVRIKKPSFFGFQAMQATKPALYLVGHWTYPDTTEPGAYRYLTHTTSAYGTTYADRDYRNKTVYVVGSPYVASVELLINGISKGTKTPSQNFLYSWTGIDVTQHGEIVAVGYDKDGGEVCRQSLETTGKATGIRLTPMTGSKGLLADGNDVAYFDVEVIDDQGRVCPTNYDRIDITVTGPGRMLGGYNSGNLYLAQYSSGYNKNYIYAECGTNRIFVRAGRTAGRITVTATLPGGESTTVSVDSKEFRTNYGLTEEMPQTLPPEYYPWPREQVSALQPLIAATSPTGCTGTFDIAPFGFDGGKIDSIEVTPNVVPRGDVTFIAGVFDADGYFRGAGMKSYDNPADLPKGEVKTVPLNYTLPTGFNQSTWDAEIFTWTSLDCVNIRDDNNLLVDYDAAARTGTVSVKVSGSMTSMVLLKPGSDPESIAPEDIAFIAQGVPNNGFADFTFKLPSDCAVGEYTVLIGSSTQRPIIAGVFNVFAPGSPTVKGVYITESITTNYPANVKVTLDVSGIGDISVSLFGKSGAVTGGTAFIGLDAADIPVISKETTYYAYVYKSGEYTGVRLPIMVVPHDDSIWSPEVTVEATRTLIEFTTDIAPNGQFRCYGPNGSPIAVTQEGNTIIADYIAKTGDILTLDGVMFPKLFKDFSYKFKLVCRKMVYVDNLVAALPRAQIRCNSEQSGNEMQKAFDGNVNNRWASNNGGTSTQNIEVDLGGSYELGNITFAWYNARAYEATIWVSDTPNPSPFTSVVDANLANRNYAGYSKAAVTVGDGTFSLNGAKGRYIAIQVSNVPSGNASIYTCVISGWKVLN